MRRNVLAILQIPYQPDPNLRGYVGGFSLGQHVYLTPHFNGVFFGKVRKLLSSQRGHGSRCSKILMVAFYGPSARCGRLCERGDASEEVVGIVIQIKSHRPYDIYPIIVSTGHQRHSYGLVRSTHRNNNRGEHMYDSVLELHVSSGDLDTMPVSSFGINANGYLVPSIAESCRSRLVSAGGPSLIWEVGLSTTVRHILEVCINRSRL